MRAAAEVAAGARAAGDPALASVAARALGIAAFHVTDLGTATRHLQEAIRLAGRAGSPELAAQARLRLAFVWCVRGRIRQALREIDRAVPDLRGTGRARAEAQRAVVFNHLNRPEEALAGYRAAVPVLRRDGDHLWLQRVLSNRAVMRGYRYDFGAAEADLREAEDLCRRLRLDLSLAIVRQNLGWVSAVRGDVPAALRHLDFAEERFRALGTHQLCWTLADRTEVLLSIGLIAEAGEAAEEAVAEFERRQRAIGLPEARLQLARTAYLRGDHAGSVREARRAARGFARQRRPEWVSLARFVALRSSVAAGDGPAEDRPPADCPAPGRPAPGRPTAGRPTAGRPARGRAAVSVRRMEECADALATAGWAVAAVEARMLAARLATERGRTATARRHLELAGRQRRRGPVVLRVRAWQAEALLRLADGRRRAAKTAVRTALRIHDEHRATLRATDLRAHASEFRVEVAEVGLRLALEDGRPAEVLAWAEQCRARHLLTRPPLPPDDPCLSDALGRLRVTVSEIEERRAAGLGPGRLAARQVALERRIRDHCRRQAGGSLAAPARPVSPGDLAAALGERALVEYVHLDDTLYAVTIAGGRVRLHRLGPAGGVREIVDRVPFALRRLARRRSPRESREAAAAMLRDAAGRLDRALLRPLAPVLGDVPLVLVPSGPLQALPWSVLPSCAGRTVTVSPSATLWHAGGRPHPAPVSRSAADGTIAAAAADRTIVAAAADGTIAAAPGNGANVTAPGNGAIVAAAGPGLPGARAEAEAVAAIHTVPALVDEEATAQRVIAALDGARLAHLAAHGRLHATNPLFSSLRLADGPLTLYDLERLRRPPELVILAACDSGRFVVRAGDELLGLSATFLALGTRAIVAPVLSILDAESATLMVALHKLLAAGHSVADALAQAQRQIAGEDAEAAAVAAGFVCLGADTALTPLP
jgi:tetratricopeptide (TPR) repeat protein